MPATLNPIRRAASLTGAVGRAQARVDEAQYLVDHLVPALDTLLAAYQQLPLAPVWGTIDPHAAGYTAAAVAFLATPGAVPAWLNANPRLAADAIAAQIGGINDELARASSELAAAQAALAAG